MPVHDLHSLLEDPHLNATGFLETLDHPSEGKIRGMRIPSRWSATQPKPAMPAPRLGQHGDEIKREARELLAHNPKPDRNVPWDR
jgi:crotonobetainyl-CoA:carnitine CoA-transferase CaiB-like acyl-CoA transferase